MIYYHGVKNRTDLPSAPRHTAYTMARAATSNCSKHSQKITAQQKEDDAHPDEELDASLQAVDFVLWYKVGRLFFAFPYAVGNRGPPNSRFHLENLEKTEEIP